MYESIYVTASKPTAAAASYSPYCIYAYRLCQTKRWQYRTKAKSKRYEVEINCQSQFLPRFQLALAARIHCNPSSWVSIINLDGTIPPLKTVAYMSLTPNYIYIYIFIQRANTLAKYSTSFSVPLFNSTCG